MRAQHAGMNARIKDIWPNNHADMAWVLLREKSWRQPDNIKGIDVAGSWEGGKAGAYGIMENACSYGKAEES